MPWFDSHRRNSERLSAYLDGELDAAALEGMERHLDGCGGCRAELEELRATVAALRELPAPAARRSFTLTPEQAARPRRPSPLAAGPLDFGVRIAAAGVAVALAAVLIVDAGGLSDGGSDGTRQAPAAESGADAQETPAPQAYDDTDGRSLTEPTGAAEDPDAPVSSDGTDASGGAGADVPSASPTPEPIGGGITPDSGDGTEPVDGGDALRPPDGAEPAPEAQATPAPGVAKTDEGESATDSGGTAQPSDAEDGGGGLAALTLAEIALAVALAALVAGSLGLAYARKRS